MREPRRIASLIVILVLGVLGMLTAWAAPALAAPPVTHPNLLLNRDEIAQMKEKIQKHDWAAKLFERVKENAKGDSVRDQALCYVITGDKSYADRVRARLIQQANYFGPQFEKLDLKQNPEYGSWSSWGADMWAYDLTYDTFSDAERQKVEAFYRLVAKTLIAGCKLWTTTPNLLIDKHTNVAMIGYCLGDAEIIDWALHDPGTPYGPRKGGFYPVMDSMIKDGSFWDETPLYELINVNHQLEAYAEAARHYNGTDLYAYVSPVSKGSIKNMIDGFIRTAFPVEDTGVGAGSIRLAMYGDGSTGFSPMGQWAESFMMNNAGAVSLTMQGDLEIGYKRYKDPAYAWLLSLDPLRANYGEGHANIWSYRALTHGEPLPEKVSPPPAPCGVYPQQGMAMLRADETPAYWTTGSLAAMVMLGRGREHGHADQYSLTLHGKGRLLYPDINVIQYEYDYLNWTRAGIGHSTLLIDHESPSAGPFTTRQEFTPEAKFFAVTGSAFPQAMQTRALLMTKEYVADVFHAADERGAKRVFDWVLHGTGRLYPGNPPAWRETNELLPYYWSVQNERGRKTDSTWHADWIQRTAGCRPMPPLGKQWFEHEVGVRMTMLGVDGTEAYYGDGGLVHSPPNFRIEGNPEGSVPVLVARRTGKAVTFAAVHEPYTGEPAITRIDRFAEIREAVAIKVTGKDFADYVLVAFDEQPHTLTAANGESVGFAGYGYLRLSAAGIVARGSLSTVPRIHGEHVRQPSFTLNGKNETLAQDGTFVTFGKPAAAPAGAGPAEDPREMAAYLHAYTLPEEVHVSALGDRPAREVEVHVRCVGPGTVAGKLRVVAPAELVVSPESLDIATLKSGEERVLKVSVRASEKALPPRDVDKAPLPQPFIPGEEEERETGPVLPGSGLYTIQFVPEEGLAAGTLKLTASVGVVITADARVPNNKQRIIRAPGYTLQLDQYLGYPSVILDADGNRRYTEGMIRTQLFTLANTKPGSNNTVYGCHDIWVHGNRASSLAYPARMKFTFEEDRFVWMVEPPSDPYVNWELNLTNFLGLKEPVRTTQKDVETTFYPPDRFRQGLKVTAPPRPADYQGKGFIIKTSQEVTFKFGTEGKP